MTHRGQTQDWQPDPKRVYAVSQAVERWRKELVDDSGRNRLRRYRDLKTGTLDLTPGREDGPDEWYLDLLLARKPVKLSELFPRTSEDGPSPFEDARRRLTTIHKRSLTYWEEKGIDTLFVAIGLASWKVAKESDPYAPIFLMPVEIEPTGATQRDFKIKPSGDARLNPVLANILQRDHEINSDCYAVKLEEKPPANLNEFESMFRELEQSWQDLPALMIDPRVVTAIFSYATMPLVTDLEENGELFAKNDLIAAIAGSEDARQSLRSKISDPPLSQPDLEEPENEFLVLDADSSQNIAINRVLGGESLVIQGPPGTGKSQTIANIVAALMAQGKRVLFVAEKQAAIEAVTKPLNKIGLSQLVMDMHGGVTSRRDFAQTLADSLASVSATPALDYSSLHSRLTENREALNANDEALHDQRQPYNLSAFEAMERLLATPECARTDISLSHQVASDISREGFEMLAKDIEDWIGLGGHLLAKDHPEWARSTIATIDEARTAFDLVTDIVNSALPAAHDLLKAALTKLDLNLPNAIGEWRSATQFIVISNKSWLGRIKAQLFSKEYGTARRALKPTGPINLSPSEIRYLEEHMGLLFSYLAELINLTGLTNLNAMSYPDLLAALNRMASGRAVAANLLRIRALAARFKEIGITPIIEKVGADIPPQYAAKTVEYAWVSRVLNDLEFEDPRISGFNAAKHSGHRDEFIESDLQHLKSNPKRILRLTAEAVTRQMDSHPQEAALIKREAAKKKRHLSVRQLFASGPHVLSALKPCWTMSPLLAAEMIPANRKLFDVVVFDEASQIPPAEAISSLARAPQAVIVGDNKQLPPTTFFNTDISNDTAVDDDDDNNDAIPLTQDIESLLDTMTPLLRDKMLQWHYRSRDARLIAFSNSRFYGGALTALPGPNVETPISHCSIPFRPVIGVSGTRSNPDEVEKVVDLVLDHAERAPQETLGVIAFGQHHANNLQNALVRRLSERNDPSLEEFLSEAKEERFFIKNIERVQGDERDAIILSVGYHKDVNEKLLYRFGPLNQEGGERRLNVAITRARSRLTLVSSFSHFDMDPSRSSAKGVEMLRQYLQYASSGGNDLGSKAAQIPLNPFELSIKDGLEKRGIPITPQYGISGYRIDFACAHPKEPGRMVLAIEADGASYHSSPTTRDRDRLRQQVLEDKGWRFHRIWSTAWFRDPEEELDRAEEAWRRAIEESDRTVPPYPVSVPIDSQQSTPRAQRSQRPLIPPRGTLGYASINDYSRRQLIDLVTWIKSDNLLRTEEEITKEVMAELGFKRSGSLIKEAIKRAIRASRRP